MSGQSRLGISLSNNLERLSLAEDDKFVDHLTYVLYEIKFPVSLSFLNVTFGSTLGFKNCLSARFFRDNSDIFSLSVIGSDLKVGLRQLSTTRPKQTEVGLKMINILHKDITLLSMIEKKFTIDRIYEIEVNEFYQRHTTNKYKVNLAFIVRNSHALRLTTFDSKTFVSFRRDHHPKDSRITEKEIWDSVSSADNFNSIFVQCLRVLLEKFFVPIPQGNLQSCFNYGGVVIDKSFMKHYSYLFSGGGVTGISLNSSTVRHRPVEVNKAPEQQQTRSAAMPMNRTPQLNSDTYKVLVENALCENRPIVVLGKGEKPFFLDLIDNGNEQKKLKVLVSLKNLLDQEIQKLDS